MSRPIGALLPAAYAVRLVLAGESIMSRPPDTRDVDRCCEIHDCKQISDPDIKKAVDECLNGGASPAPSASSDLGG